jgi:hypothetical protein
MNDKPVSRRWLLRRPVFDLILLAFLCSIVAWAIWTLRVDPTTKVELRPEFEQRQVQWGEAHVHHYRVAVYSSNPYTLLCPHAILEVEQGRVVSVEPLEESVAGEDSDHDCTHYYQALTIENAFEIARNYLYDLNEDALNAEVEIRYDEQYGFPSRLAITKAMVGDMPDIAFKAFEVLD